MFHWRVIGINRKCCCHYLAFTRRKFSSSSISKEDAVDDVSPRLRNRVWKARSTETGSVASSAKVDSVKDLYWTDRVVDKSMNGSMNFIEDFVQKISDRSDILGGKMREKQLGVLHQDPATDMQMLMENYTVKAVASALRDREDALQEAAVLASENRIEELITFLQKFHPKYVLERRRLQKQSKRHISRFNPDDLNDDITAPAGTTDPISALHLDSSRQVLRKMLMRMPRTITSAHSKRAAVCVALCLSHGVPSILLEKRATHLRSHPDEVCLPGGMVCDVQDQTIVSTSIREMKEEIGGLDNDAISIEVIGILRLNWGDVHHLTGVAVTPVVCYLGEVPELSPNPEEVSEVFTIPLVDLLNKAFWIHKEQLAPIFVGGPYVIWGLTGYILERLSIELGRLRQS